VAVSEGEAIRFAPGEFQHGYNDGDERVVAFEIGPQAGSEEVLAEWGACGREAAPGIEMTDDEDAIEVDCPEYDHRIARLT
jgi:hypothetical protein